MPCQGPVHLRRAGVADAAGIAHVHVAGWQEAHAGLVPADYAACMRARSREDFWHGELAVEAPDRKPWVALIDERIVGFASGGLSRDDDADARCRRGLPGLCRARPAGVAASGRASCGTSFAISTTTVSSARRSGSSRATRGAIVRREARLARRRRDALRGLRWRAGRACALPARPALAVGIASLGLSVAGITARTRRRNTPSSPDRVRSRGGSRPARLAPWARSGPRSRR